MFFTTKFFKDHGFKDETADYLRKVCDQFIDENSEVVTGEVLTNGAITGFSNKRESHHSHTGLILGLHTMGTEKPHAAPIKLDRATKEDHEAMLSDRVKQLERDLKIARGNQ